MMKIDNFRNRTDVSAVTKNTAQTSKSLYNSKKCTSPNMVTVLKARVANSVASSADIPYRRQVFKQTRFSVLV